MRRMYPLKEIKANPFRNLKQHPLDEALVERLGQSIAKTGAWGDGRLTVRLGKRGVPQLVFGHLSSGTTSSKQ